MTFDVNRIRKSNVIIAQFIFRPINNITASSGQPITFPFALPTDVYTNIRRFTTNDFIGLAYTTSTGINMLSGECVADTQYICELFCDAVN